MQLNSSASFGDLLKRFRLAAGLSQEALAERAGLSPRGVSDLERGARTSPRPGTVRLLADALALSETDRAAFLAAAQGAKHQEPVTSADAEVPRAPPYTPSISVPSSLAPLSPPTGTVTFLFTDIEGSTKLLQQLGGPRYADVLGDHQRLLRLAFAAHGGYEVDTQGDSFFVAFPAAPDALAAAVEATQAIAVHPWSEYAMVRVRMGLHSGAPQLVGERYVGLDVHRAARIAAAGHGGQILLSASTAELARHAPPEGIVTLRDLGAHRLKDLQQAERIYEAIVPGLVTDFPPLNSLDARPHNLPVHPTPILGREREIAAICSLLRREDVRLVTLTGPGGIGKTRLSVQVAAEVLDVFPDGAWNVRLSRLTDPNLVLPTIATTLDLKEGGTTPLADVLREYARDKCLLLVLDNFEQVVAAASSVAEVLESSPGVKILVTSRVPLHLRGEYEYAVHPLALPDPTRLPPAAERVSQYAAVALFIERAQATQADFAVTNATAPAVAEICSQLDGLPLAIELAAARIKLLPPPALLKRLERTLPVLTGGARDADERQQTMRNTLAWSYELLAPEEQCLFRRLAVFVGGCTLEAAEAVCVAPEGAKPLRIDVLDGLGRLVDQSLVQQRAERNEPRFGLLHVVREFALEQLEEHGEGEQLRQTHAAYYVRVADAEQTWPAAYAAKDATALAAHIERLEPEQDNLRAALAWLRARATAARQRDRTGRMNRSKGKPATSGAMTRRAGDGGEVPTVQGLCLAGALLWSWAYHGRLSEGREWVEAFLALDTPPDTSTGLSPSALAAQGDLRADAASAQAAAREDGRPLTVRRRSRTMGVLSADEASVRARAVYAAGVLAYWQGDSARAVSLLEQSLGCWQALDDRLTIAMVLNNLGMAVQDLGDHARARACYEQSLALGRALGSRFVARYALGNLAALTFTAGDLERAAVYSEEALTLSRQDDDHAASLWLGVQALIVLRRGDLSQAAVLAAEAVAEQQASGDVRHLAEGLEVCAIIRASQGHAARAARLLGAAAVYRERIGMRRRIDVPTADDIEAAVIPARTALGETAWATAYAAGRALSLEEAIAEALGEERVRQDHAQSTERA